MELKDFLKLDTKIEVEEVDYSPVSVIEELIENPSKITHMRKGEMTYPCLVLNGVKDRRELEVDYGSEGELPVYVDWEGKLYLLWYVPLSVEGLSQFFYYKDSYKLELYFSEDDVEEVNERVFDNLLLRRN